MKTVGPELLGLIELLSRLPGFGPRSARRAALHLLKQRERLMLPLAAALGRTAAQIERCSGCGTFDTSDPCAICSAPDRDRSAICVVEEVADLWAMEKSGAFCGLYHVLGGVLSALDGVGPDELNIASLLQRAGQLPEDGEVILALGATLDGQTTAHYLNDRLGSGAIKVTRIAHGVPVGGELDYLDDGTITAAINSRLGM